MAARSTSMYAKSAHWASCTTKMPKERKEGKQEGLLAPRAHELVAQEAVRIPGGDREVAEVGVPLSTARMQSRQTSAQGSIPIKVCTYLGGNDGPGPPGPRPASGSSATQASAGLGKEPLYCSKPLPASTLSMTIVSGNSRKRARHAMSMVPLSSFSTHN